MAFLRGRMYLGTRIAMVVRIQLMLGDLIREFGSDAPF
jgi:hypothetical protein